MFLIYKKKQIDKKFHTCHIIQEEIEKNTTATATEESEKNTTATEENEILPDYITCPECRKWGTGDSPIIKKIREECEICPDQKTQMWLENRGKCITTTDVASIINMNPYANRTDLLYKKMKVDMFNGNEATRWGEAHEDEAIQKFEMRTGHRVTTFGLLKITTEHGEKIKLPYLAGSPDGILNCGGGIVEVKCPFRKCPFRRKIKNCDEIQG